MPYIFLVHFRVSLDGFRSDKLDEFLKNNLNNNLQKYMLNEGIRVQYMRPSFPTLTFPNHFTLVTGLYMESHAIVSNTFYDPKYDVVARMIGSPAGQDIKFWNATEPIWESAKKQGLRTASSFWAGSEVWGKQPDIFLSYNDNYYFESRCDEIINWFTKFDLDFATLYFNEPDHTGHDFGPDSKEYADQIVAVDKAMGYLFEKLEAAKLLTNLNIIVTSDHGMASMSETLLVKNYVDVRLIDYKKTVYGIVSNIWPANETVVSSPLFNNCISSLSVNLSLVFGK
jgi:ectonucleotide pyrophosphatase/phosphodiesterase family protein 5